MLLPENLQNLSNQISSPPAGQPVLPIAVETQVDAHLHKIDSFFSLELGIHKEVIALHLVLDCQKSFSNSFCLWLWACLRSSVCLLGKSSLWKQLTPQGFSFLVVIGKVLTLHGFVDVAPRPKPIVSQFLWNCWHFRSYVISSILHTLDEMKSWFMKVKPVQINPIAAGARWRWGPE